MSKQARISSTQGDRLSREVPGGLVPDSGRLLPKLAVAVFLGLGLAIIGTVTDESTKETVIGELEPLGAGQPPAIIVDRKLAERVRPAE